MSKMFKISSLLSHCICVKLRFTHYTHWSFLNEPWKCLSLEKWLRVNFSVFLKFMQRVQDSPDFYAFVRKKEMRTEKNDWQLYLYKHQTNTHAFRHIQKKRKMLTLSLLHVSIFNLARILKWQINLHGCCWGLQHTSFTCWLCCHRNSQVSNFPV